NGLRLAYGKLMGGAVTREPFIGLGSAKSNIGHLEAAAGLAGVVKVLMAMRRGELPASLHCAEINPHIELDDGPFYLVRQRTAWPRRRDRADRELPRRAAVSSFGFGGTNAHVVLEENPPERAVPRRRPLRARTFADTRYWIPGMRGADRATGIASENDLVLQTPSWVAAAGPSTATPPAGSRARIVVACEIGVSERPSETPIALIVRIDATSGDISMRYREAAGVLLDTLRREIRSTRTDPVLVQLVVPLGDERELFEGLGAMLDSASAECPRIIGQVVGVPGRLAPGDVAKILADEARAPNDRRIRHHDGRRFVRVWSDLPGRLDPAATEGPRWRDGGIYLIVGGMGALGRLIAHDIATRASSAVLVLVGTSPLDADRAAFLEKLGAMGARADYVQADVASAADIAAAVRETVDRHGGLHGVVHCAGVIRDGYVLNKTRADLDAVLAPKVTGTAALARACQGQALDFLVLFSSLAGAVGNAGQADYAAANGFMDAFAAQQGATVVAVNWPLWRDGGMRVDTETEAAFFRQMGQRPLSLASGLSALGTALACGARQLAVVEGEGGTIRKFFARASRHDGIQAGADHSAPWGADSRDDDLRGLVDRCVEALRRVFARISGLPAERIEAQASLDEYGIDSLMITRMNRELGDAFGAISKTLLFEHRSLNELARYLARQHTEACRRWVGAGDARAPALRAPPNTASARSTAATSRAAAPAGAEPIAVIGLSGRYPGAPDLAQFWANLVAGKDLIREVSAERWPLDGFFHPDPSEAVARQMSYSKWGGFLEGFADFDPLFFKIAPRDAAAMDPQERLFLMAAWTACEDAG
ncbi:MAG TPA: SDR family NAD(P)-dependent oxidoreductase, partial [Xanthobacteraceae bacterium]